MKKFSGAIVEGLICLAVFVFHDWPSSLNGRFHCGCLAAMGKGGLGVKNKQYRADDLLVEGARTFAERNAIYGDSYLTLGGAMATMFPKGLSIKPGDVAAFQRLGAFMQIVSKCCRYATPLATGGGHCDSARDMMVYAAILEEVTDR